MSDSENIKRQIRETTTYKVGAEFMGESETENILNRVVNDDITPACCYHCPYIDCLFYKSSDQLWWSMSCERYIEYKNTGEINRYVN